MKNQFLSHGSRNRPGSLRPHRMPFHLFIGPLMEQAENRKRSVGTRPYLECLEARSLLTVPAVSAVSPANVGIGVDPAGDTHVLLLTPANSGFNTSRSTQR